MILAAIGFTLYAAITDVLNVGAWNILLLPILFFVSFWVIFDTVMRNK